ncbi:carboxylesterase/lipase family protein [Novosphingobium piscinae]|uniref:Carboxylic ester hydrolase n=1 Tax=Novosphingobium piscinae TaxID=1507448 RepID=A0A7X1KR62_9SPHN|nr:carboxylesterase family protein [Novosphingobium piscinae]MBC2670305.1 carboxylesterase/lipase family protein [Novosphingobium piscinae]
MQRRRFLTCAGATATAAAFPGLARAERLLGPVVETASGKLRGFTGAGIRTFLGVPYGTAERFRRAVPPSPWPGVRDALGWGADAPQRAPARSDHPYALVASDLSMQPLRSEDCLVLNVWTPATDSARRPVMVWLHGGGFVSGSAATAVHDGANLARDGDIVVVSLNHRLNVLGFTHFDDPDFAESANLGMLDIELALRWVRDNIAAFGGDPGMVTLFGYSGGGQKISTLMAMPSAKGLFHRAIIQSGQGPRLLKPAQAATNTERLFAAMGVPRGDIRALQTAPLDRLIAGFAAVWAAPPRQLWGLPARFSPVVDGQIIPRHPIDSLELSADVPLVLGSTRQEMAAVSLMWEPNADQMTATELGARLQPWLGNAVPEVLEGYRRIHPMASPWDLYTLITADVPTRINSIDMAEKRQALGRAPTFMYRVDWQCPVFGGRMKAPHGIEVPLAFRNVREDAGLNGGGADAFALSEQISRAWLRFAHHGRPGWRRLVWPAYTVDRRETMLFDRPSRVVGDPGSAERQLLARVLPSA